MLGLAAYDLLGGQLHLPMPGRRRGGAAGPLGVYSLGIFSGVAGSCCAPVLAGVIASPYDMASPAMTALFVPRLDGWEPILRLPSRA